MRRCLRIKYEADCRGWWPKNYMNLRKPNLGISGGAGFKIGRSLLNPKAEKSTGIWLVRRSLVWWRQQPSRRIFLNALYLVMLQSNHSFHLCYGYGVVFLPFSIFPLWVEVKGKCSRSIIMILSPSWQATSTPSAKSRLWGTTSTFRTTPHGVEISGFFCHSDFTLDQFWRI